MSLDISLLYDVTANGVPVVVGEGDDPLTYTAFELNITHNLAPMARAVGLYVPMWSPGDCGYVIAEEIIPHLELGLERLHADPEGAARLNPSNGWGSYNNLLESATKYLAACRLHPKAKIWVSR